MFIESVVKVYKGTEEGNDMIGTFLFIFILLVIIFYFYCKVSQTQIILDWENQRCNPKYLFFSHYINPVNGENPYKAINDNFIRCIKPLASIINTDKYRDFKHTTNNISKTTNSLSNYVNTINSQVNEKINAWDISYNKLDLSANSVDDKLDEKYVDRKNFFIQVKVYAERIHDILYAITSFVKNKLLYRVSRNKDMFKINNHDGIDFGQQDKNLNQLKDYLYNTYYSTCTTEYTQAFELLKAKKKQPNYSPETTDFSICISKGNDAIKKYENLINLLDEFERQNDPINSPDNSLLVDTISSCYQLKQFNAIGCQEILPNWTTADKMVYT